MIGRRAMALAMAVGLSGLLVGAMAVSRSAEESASLFTASHADSMTLLDVAGQQGLEALRILSGPGGLRAESGKAPAHTLYVVIEPPRPFSADEAQALREFLEAGGRLLVVDNFGHANSLTVPFGIAFERVRLVAGIPNGTYEAGLGGRAYTLMASAPTALHVAGDQQILARSGPASFIDRDGDGFIQASEPHGPFAIIAQATIGTNGGRIVAIADPGLLRAGPAEQVNQEFLQDLLLDMLPFGGRILVDESRNHGNDPVLRATAALVGAATSQWGFVLAGLAAALCVVAGLAPNATRWANHQSNALRVVKRREILQASERPEDPPSTPQVHWTRRGRMAASGGVLLAVAGLAFGNEQATSAAAVLLLGCVLSLWTRPGRVSARRIGPAGQLDENATAEVSVTLRPSRRQDHVEVLDALPGEFEVCEGSNWLRVPLRPNQEAAFRYAVRPLVRGPYQVGPLAMRSRDMFGLRTIETPLAAGAQCLVLPRRIPLNRIPFKSRIPQLTMGPHLVSRAGDGTEFHALRGYQQGDSIRIVNWKASARSKEMVVNQRIHESKATLTVFLDARAITGAGPVLTNPLNEGCRATMSIVAGGLQARDQVRVIVYGAGVQELCRDTGQGKAHLIAESLAHLSPTGESTFLEAVQAIVPSMQPGSPAILVSGLEADPTILEGLELLGKRSIRPTVVALALGTEDPHPKPAPDADPQAVQAAAIARIRSTAVPVAPAIPGTPLDAILRIGLS